MNSASHSHSIIIMCQSKMSPFVVAIVIISMAHFSSACLRRSEVYSPRSSQELNTVLKSLSGGAVIELFPVEYSGDFLLPARAHTMILKGSMDPATGRSTIIRGTGSGPVLTVEGGNWDLQALTILGGPVGVHLKGNGYVLKGLAFEGINEAVKIEGTGNVLRGISIKDGDKGITIRGNKTVINALSVTGSRIYGLSIDSGIGNTISSYSSSGSPASLLINEASCCGTLDSISADGIVDLRGDNYVIHSLSVKGALNIIGCHNTFTKSNIKDIFLTRKCNNDVDGTTNNIRTLLSAPAPISAPIAPVTQP